MSYLAYYRKYRPYKFGDMCGQKEIINVIKNEVLNEKISHAYLFSGPRGTGKTTTAKILARMVNCSNLKSDGEPCGECNFCKNFNESSDVIEIDAASNNGVDEIRNIRDKVNLVPSQSKYKVYIIDEVHMLTTQAFNALLKTLEEPPKHVIFILATTEFYKIPVTVISRCQKFQFEKVTNDEIVERLKYICENESINSDDKTLYEIARLSDGGMRDAINMLDQLSSFSNNNIKIDDVFNLGGIYSYDLLTKLLNNISNCDYEKILCFCDNINNSGKNISKFMEEFISFIKDIILYKNSKIKNNLNIDYDKISDFDVKKLFSLIIGLNEALINIKKSEVPSIMISIYLMKLSEDIFDSKVETEKLSDITKVNTIKNEINQKKDDFPKISLEKEKKEAIKINKNLIINNTFATASKKKLELSKEKFKNIKDYLTNSKYAYEAGLLNDTNIVVCGDGYMMMTVCYNSLIDRIYNDISKIIEFLSVLLEEKFKIVVLSEDEWNYQREQFLLKKNKGEKYVFIDDKLNISNQNEEKNSDEEKIIEILGKDMIEYV